MLKKIFYFTFKILCKENNIIIFPFCSEVKGFKYCHSLFWRFLYWLAAFVSILAKAYSSSKLKLYFSYTYRSFLNKKSRNIQAFAGFSKSKLIICQTVPEPFLSLLFLVTFAGLSVLWIKFCPLNVNNWCLN